MISNGTSAGCETPATLFATALRATRRCIRGKAGLRDKANKILTESRRSARKDANGWRWAFLWLLALTMGYGLGLRYFLSLAWVLLFTVIGVFVLLDYQTKLPEPIAGPVGQLAYSLGELVPLAHVTLPKPLDAVVELYLIFHRLVGLALAACVTAGIAGLTQKLCMHWTRGACPSALLGTRERIHRGVLPSLAHQTAALRPTEASKAAVCYVRNTSFCEVRSLTETADRVAWRAPTTSAGRPK